MKASRHLLLSIAMMMALGLVAVAVLQNSGVASGYPPPPTSGTVSSQSLTPRAYLPLILNVFPPITSTSYYVRDPAGLSVLAQALGQSDANTPGKQDHLVILNFGTPGQQSGQYGTYMARASGFISTSQVNNAGLQFATQWWISTGSDFDSRLTLVIGTNTSGGGVTTAHAQAWAQAVDPLRQYFLNCCSGQVSIVGGVDAEIGASPPWNSAATNIAWVDAYVTNSTCSPGQAEGGCLYDFGNALCPETGFGNCSYSWSMNNAWYISYGARRSGNSNPFVLPLPEIYNTVGSNARQWKNLSLYAATCTSPCQPATTGRSGKLYFVGTLTEEGACVQVATLGESCAGIDNPPTTGYMQLYNELNKDSRTTQSPIRWITDIKYQTFP